MAIKKIQVGQSVQHLALIGTQFRLLAATGKVKVKFYGDGWSEESEFYSGLGVSSDKPFSSFDISAGSEQNITLWVGSLRLDDDSAALLQAQGSEGVKASRVAVFYNRETKLCDVELGRASLMVNSNVTMWVGGLGVTPQTGYKLEAGQALTLNTQGAVYAVAGANGEARLLEEVN